jgi:hypothetical protein
MTHDEDLALFRRKMGGGAQSVISGSKDLFEPPVIATTFQTAGRFASATEALLDSAPTYGPKMSQSLDHSRESVRQFIKTASQLFGRISVALESV